MEYNTNVTKTTPETRPLIGCAKNDSKNMNFFLIPWQTGIFIELHTEKQWKTDEKTETFYKSNEHKSVSYENEKIKMVEKLFKLL